MEVLTARRALLPFVRSMLVRRRRVAPAHAAASKGEKVNAAPRKRP